MSAVIALPDHELMDIYVFTPLYLYLTLPDTLEAGFESVIKVSNCITNTWTPLSHYLGQPFNLFSVESALNLMSTYDPKFKTNFN